MTFKDWTEDHEEKVASILLKLKGQSNKQIASYFHYDNMVEKEPDFCPLYATNTKCHDMKELNCFLCSCPFFKYSDDEPLAVKDGVKVMSQCAINAKEAGKFVTGDAQQCDCTGCTIPHKQRFTESHLELIDPANAIQDAISTLEWLRGLQLADILGKYKIF